ncbi:hypothetical protein [Neolewinella litorea]|uniref:Uncharacterized protein n=1 Tax=Neolewinella litorea TaxID=2562452 RepID=A0A4S4NR83_9BACT|nr:hypothetical protein [Neolewinella litorea]THH41697.1 hypothetical protein E4021_03620 [Neolewinella litorea]
MIRYALPVIFLLGCSDSPPTTPETRPVENPNAGNTAIYDVDADDPYEIADSSFLDLSPGMALPQTESLREAGVLTVGDQTFDRYFLTGRRQDTLAYLLVDRGDRFISAIHITSSDVVTRDGLRVGNTYGELVERLGKLPAPSTVAGRPVIKGPDWLSYQLGAYAPSASGAGVPAETPIEEIILIRQ